ncbi:MAG: ATP-binding cassette domain-containing protein [Deltaproteobacteria bacterium]|nr:ATP-binding cassette domain-containing protein [Deltaproteobacteria bacterium]MBW2123659.1 ATP-binding cassette domain-containing protein [Deltaproteobacteria bacterium]
METLLEVDNVTLGYSEDIDILHDVSVRIAASTITGMIGLNGAGKTTFVKGIYGFLKPKRGRILLEGEDITNAEPYMLIHKGIWYLPQDSSLFPYLSVEDNLSIPTRPLQLSRLQVRGRMEEVFDQFPDLRDKRKKKAGDLSGGQQKMLECAKVMMVKPRLLFVDEPTVGLAPKFAMEMYERIVGFLHGGMTVFLIDHNVRQLIKLSSYIYVMSLGRITSEGPQDRFKGELKHQVRQWLGF